MRVRLKRDRLLELLARSGRSQNAWALRMGLSKGHWSDLVNGRHPHPSAKTRERILEAFGVSFEELFEIEDAPASGAGAHSSLPERYVVDREIGEGAMGLVYLARDTRFGRRVALKLVSPEAVSDLGGKRFLKEIHRSGRLLHPNVLPVLDAGEAAGHPYYVTPYIEEGSLRSLLNETGPLTLDEALPILRGIAAALDHAHARGTLHGDVKPDNVLLADGHAYVADFGLSRAIHLEELRDWARPPEIDIGAGTPAYVSPEQARGRSDLDARSDIYSLACVAFEMLAGRPPFQGGSTTELIRRRFDSVPPDLRRQAPDLREEACQVIATAMAVDRERRPASATELVERLELARTEAESETSSLALTTISSVARWAAARASTRPRGALMSSIVQDLLFSVRSLGRRPLFALITVITLALGIGANAAIFSVVHAVVLSPLPYEEPERLVVVRSTYEGRPCCPLSAPNFLDLRTRADQVEDLAAYTPASFVVTGDGEPARLSGYTVSHGFFELLGAEPQVGRFPTPADDDAGAEPVVVISDQLWRDRYAGDPEIVGKEITVDSVAHTIIGVAPPDSRVGGRPQIFQPYAWDPESMPGRGSNFVFTLARLQPGTSQEVAAAELEALYADIVAAYPDSITNKGVALMPLEEYLLGDRRRRPVLVLWGAVAMVLLVACANAVNLMLARAEHRQQELAVRSALGAGRGRLVRHFLSESLLVSLAGGIVGIAGAYAGLGAVLATFGDAVPRSDDVGIDTSVLAFTLALSILAGLLVGLVPAWQTRGGRLQAALKEQGRGEAGGRSRLRQALVVIEVGAALVLVVGAGLMLKSFWRLSQVDVGVDAGHLLEARVSLPQARYPDRAEALAFWQRLRDEAERLPGVDSASVTNAVPFSGTYNNFSRISPTTDPELAATFVEIRTADPSLFETLRLPLLSGRNFTGADNADDDAPLVAIINRALAERIFPDQDPVGRTVAPGGGSPEILVIGVAENLREHGPERPVPPKMYFHLLQSGRSTMSLLVRTAGDPLQVIPQIRGIVADIDPELPVFDVHSLEQLIYQGLSDRRFSLSLLSVFAGLALALGAIGIYGVMAYTVEKRTREIGLRQALGASPGSVLRLVVLQGLGLTATGIVIGGGCAFLLRRTISSLLFEVDAFDPAVYAGVALVLATTAALACLVPARRASRLDPMDALRDQ